MIWVFSPSQARPFLFDKRFAGASLCPMSDTEKELQDQIQNLANEMCAKFTVLQSALETVIAQRLSSLPPQKSKQWKAAFLQHVHNPQLSATLPPGGEQIEAAISARSIVLAQEFIRFVDEKEAECRAVSATEKLNSSPIDRSAPVV